MADENKNTGAQEGKETSVNDKGSQANEERNPVLMGIFNNQFGKAYEGGNEQDAGQQSEEDPPKDNGAGKTEKDPDGENSEDDGDQGETGNADMGAKISEYEEKLASYEERMAKYEEKIAALSSYKSEKKDDVPQMPTKAEWEADPESAANKLLDYREYQRELKEKEAASKKTAEEQIKAQKEFSRNFWKKQSDLKEKIFKDLVNDHPELKDKNSRLYKEADRILKERSEKEDGFKLNPYCDFICVNEAVRNLKAAAASGADSKKSQLNKGAFIMQPASGSGNEKKSLSPAEFDALPRAQREAYMKEEYMGRGKT